MHFSRLIFIAACALFCKASLGILDLQALKFSQIKADYSQHQALEVKSPTSNLYSFRDVQSNRRHLERNAEYLVKLISFRVSRLDNLTNYQSTIDRAFSNQQKVFADISSIQAQPLIFKFDFKSDKPKPIHS